MTVDVAGDSFRIDNLAPGTYQLLVTSPGRQPEVAEVTIGVGGTANCDFLLTGYGD